MSAFVGMPEPIDALFPNPREVGSSEYSAMWQCIADGLEDVPEEEQADMARAMLLEFRGWADYLLNRFPDSHAWAKVVVEVLGGVAEVTQATRGIEVKIIDHDNEALELVRCPRCEGEGMIETPDGAADHGWEDEDGMVPCPTCGGHGVMTKAELREEWPELVSQAQVIAWA